MYMFACTATRDTDGCGCGTVVTSSHLCCVLCCSAMQVLNEKFSGDIEAPHTTSFPDAYFTCDKRCLVCG